MQHSHTTTLALAAMLLWAAATTRAQGYTNPVLPGFFPDPSVCCVGDDYYMVNSSFQYYPGVPIHHSKDLIHWEAIGHCLTTETQANLKDVSFWGGIYAPTIRYNDGTFYMVTTNCSYKGNFIVYTDDPRGTWSEPVWLEQGGIDPSLYFEDGHCYLVSNPNIGIDLCEINPKTGEQLTPGKTIWRGTGGRHPEAPHIYKKDNYYYLLIAEGGTEYGHKVTIARSEKIDGPYEPNPSNPILTHINRNAQDNAIQGTGHADIFQAHDGSWWLVCLGFRPQSYSHHLLGRETFLAPVRWDERAWPVVNGDGTIAIDMQCATLEQTTAIVPAVRTTFDQPLNYDWNYLSYPRSECYSQSARKGYLRIASAPVGLDSNDSPAFVGRRQQHIAFTATTELDYQQLADGGQAGLTVYMGHEHHHTLAVKAVGDERVVALDYRLGALRHNEATVRLTSKKVQLRVEGTADYYIFSCSTDGGKTFSELGRIDTRFLSSETVGGFTGIYLGLYAEGASDKHSAADFHWFDYQPAAKQ